MALVTRPGSRYLSASLGVSSASYLAGRYAAWLDRQDTLCPFARYVGWQCPFCGATRSFLYLISGSPHIALERNIGVVLCFVAGVLAGIWYDSLQERVMYRTVLDWFFCEKDQSAVERRWRHRY